jgi:DNA-binding NtrC family response regulator
MLNQKRILIIDDEKVVRDACARMLSKNGCFVIQAENGKTGLAELDKASEEIDVILLDLMMPGMSGIEVLEKIQASDHSFVVVVITGYASVGNAIEAIEKGAYDFIAKPFTPEKLSKVVKKALEWRTQKTEVPLSGQAMGESRVKQSFTT